MSSVMRLVNPPCRPETDRPELDRLLHPGRFYDQPADVLRDHRLSRAERRAILSSWASDACAVESCPTLRTAPYGRQPVTFDSIIDALRELDRHDARIDKLMGGVGLPDDDRHAPN
jgi:hypothetical protein